MNNKEHVLINVKLVIGLTLCGIFFFHVLWAVFHPVKVDVTKIDSNGDGRTDVLNVYHNGFLKKELIDFSYTNKYDLKVIWRGDGSVVKIARYLDADGWFVEYYNEPTVFTQDSTEYMEQTLNVKSTFSAFDTEHRNRFPYYYKTITIAGGRILLSKFYHKGTAWPFAVGVHDSAGRYRLFYRDDDSDGSLDVAVGYVNGVLSTVNECSIKDYSIGNLLENR